MPLLKAPYKKNSPLIRLLFVLALVLILSGCRFQGFGPFGRTASLTHQAEQAFLQGDFPAARESYALLAARTDNPGSVRAGQYGMACTDMATAKDAAAFRKAMESFLHIFPDPVQQPSAGLDSQNPTILVRAVSHGMALMATEHRDMSARIDRLSAKEAIYKKDRLRMQHLVKTLQHQISVLESIDQERQEKRKDQ